MSSKTPPNGAPLAVDVRNLTIAYGERVVVSDVCFSVEPGEIFGIVGPNGAGKTSTVECVEGLRSPTAGEIRVFGHMVPQSRRELTRLVGVQLQDGRLPSRATVGEVTRLFRSFYGKGPTEDEVLDSVGLSQLRRSMVDRLSGGEQQRLSVGLALLGSPRLLCLDELTTGLDPGGRRTIWEVVKRLRDEGMTIVLTSHFMDEVEHLCSRVALFLRGHVDVASSPAAMIASANCPHRFRISRETLRDQMALELQVLPTVTAFGPDGGDLVFSGQWDALKVGLEQILERYGVSLFEVRHETPSLEDAFLKLTGEQPGGDDRG